MDECPNDIIPTYLINIFNLTNIYRHTFIMSKSYSRLIHNTYISLYDFVEIEWVMPDCIKMFLWIFVIDTINFSCFHDDITVELEGPEDRTGISRKVGIPRTSHTYHDSSLLYMSECSASYEVLCYSLSRYSTSHSDIYSLILYCFSDCKTIDDRTHHTHIVTRHPIESSFFELYTPKNITSSYNNYYFKFLHFYKVYYLLRKKREKFWINSISLISLKSFSGKFKKDTLRYMVFLHF